MAADHWNISPMGGWCFPQRWFVYLFACSHYDTKSTRQISVKPDGRDEHVTSKNPLDFWMEEFLDFHLAVLTNASFHLKKTPKTIMY